MKVHNVIVFLLFTLFCVACAPGYLVKTDPFTIIATNPYFDTKAIALPCERNSMNHTEYTGCHFFNLIIDNKTNSDISVNWNKTLYIRGGQTAGNFMFEGVRYLDRDTPKSPSVIFANGRFIKKIYPNILVEYDKSSRTGWYNSWFPQGVNGIYLTVNVNGIEVTEKLVTTIEIIKYK